MERVKGEREREEDGTTKSKVKHDSEGLRERERDR